MRTDPGAYRAPRPDAPRWRKALASNPNGNCVEVAVLAADRIGVRNSRCPDGGVLVVPPAFFHALVVAARSDDWAAGRAVGRRTDVADM